jgi:hypothetical protein
MDPLLFLNLLEIMTNLYKIFTKTELKLLYDYIPKWYIGNQAFPIEDRFGRNLINLRGDLLDNRSPGELKLFEYCKGIFKDLIPQYPILITNPTYWRECLKMVGLYGDRSLMSRNYFVLDMYSPTYDIAIEADYESTHIDKYDLIRDNFVNQEFGINTYRFKDYGKCRSINKTINRDINRIHNRTNPNKISRVLDYRQFIICQWIYNKNPDLMTYLEYYYPDKPYNNALRKAYEDLCSIIHRKA